MYFATVDRFLSDVVSTLYMGNPDSPSQEQLSVPQFPCYLKGEKEVPCCLSVELGFF